jgi:hypothetical protein
MTYLTKMQERERFIAEFLRRFHKAPPGTRVYITLTTRTDRPPTTLRRFLRYPLHRDGFGSSSRIRPPRIGLMPTGLLRATVARIDVAVG